MYQKMLYKPNSKMKVMCDMSQVDRLFEKLNDPKK